MSSLIHKIQSNYKFISTTFLFFIAFLLIAYMMPRSIKFNYEFQMNSPWKHEDLTAPFKFGILKTNEEMAPRRDSVLADLKLLFEIDTATGKSEVLKFKESFNRRWIEYSLRNFYIASKEAYTEGMLYVRHRRLQEQYSTTISRLLEQVYSRGIIELPDSEVAYQDSSEIGILKGPRTVGYYTRLAKVYSQKTAYEYVRDSLKMKMEADNSDLLKAYAPLFKRFDLQVYLYPNLIYNLEASKWERDSRLKSMNVSKTKGMMQQGQRIVSKGEIVTPEIYQILISFKEAFDQKGTTFDSFLVLLGKLIFVVFSLVLMYIFLFNFRREVLRDIVKASFILFLVVLMFFIASATAKLDKISFYIIPFTILPIILRTFFDERVAVFIHVLTTLIIGIIAPDSYEFIIMNILAGIVAIFSLTNLYRRSRFFLSALLVFVTFSLSYIGLQLIKSGTLSDLELVYFANFGINGVLILVSFLLIYIFEKTFGFLSDTTLMELADTNQPLLRRLAEIAPGTFQHSMQVANLSEDAIHRIGGNPLLVRTGALYHDIGKMYDPALFIENQTGGVNPHDEMPFGESANKIINHVSKGVELAKKNNLPEAIINFIQTHHGTTTVQYFYRSYVKTYPEKDVDVKDFSYPGPKPFSKEMAVLMMADSVEAASRSLGDYTLQTLSGLVEKIINYQLNSGQFDDAPITFQDIASVKEVFKVRLKNIYHARISYPE
ncbi:MAG: HDIG domain-containing protein [Bacteroidales bacterium]|nr:HDIG domain-containing protein [Bacteroidales bacterium]